MTCQVIAVGHDGSTYKARALLDSASSASFVTERIAQRLRLSRCNHGSKITGISRKMMQLSSRGSVHFHIKSAHTKGIALILEVLVLPKITSVIPSYIVAFDSKWKHSADLELADPDFGTPSSIDILLGADIFSRMYSMVEDLGRRERHPHSRPLSDGFSRNH